MHFTQSQVASLVLSASTATAASLFDKRDVSWGPIVGLTDSSSNIIATTSTIYPGQMPQDQQGYMFAWIGLGNGTGDLVQSIVGSYPSGLSECSGTSADTTWCISSEVYGLDDTGATVQFVGDKRTADVNYENGIIFNYTLIDKSTYTWEQTMTDAVTGDLLATYQKKSGPMTLWNTAIELQDYNGADPSGTIEPQYYVNTTIYLDGADETYSDKLYTEDGATTTDMTTSDGGVTWFIEKITIPAMDSSSSSSSNSSSSSSTDSSSGSSSSANSAIDSSYASASSAVSPSFSSASSAGSFPAYSASSGAFAPSQTEGSNAWGPGSQNQQGQSGGFGGW